MREVKKKNPEWKMTDFYKNRFVWHAQREETPVDAREKAAEVKYMQETNKTLLNGAAFASLFPEQWLMAARPPTAPAGREDRLVQGEPSSQPASHQDARSPSCLWSLCPITFPFGKIFHVRNQFSGNHRHSPFLLSHAEPRCFARPVTVYLKVPGLLHLH